MKIIAEYPNPPQICRVIVQDGILQQIGRIVKRLKPSQVYVLTNTTLRKLYYGKLQESLSQAGFRVHPLLVIPDGERFKSLDSLRYCYDRLINYKADRESLLLTLGGGVITDLGGAVAATYMRGIKLVHVPTTLVAQVDASVGGKNGINHTRAKNIIGSFYHAQMILVDPQVLETLSQRHYLNGLVEVIKIGLVSNPGLFSFIQNNIDPLLQRQKKTLLKLIVSSIRQKLEITTTDPQEQGLRKILNFGHTFGHALETKSNYTKLSHGETVSLGILVALKLSLDLKLANTKLLKMVQSLLQVAGLPTQMKRVDIRQIWEIMYMDKKAGYGRINFVLLEELGKPILRAVNFQDFKRAIEIIS